MSEALRRRDEARSLIASGKDPSRERQCEKVRAHLQAGDTFTAIADEFCAKRKRDGDKGWAPATATRSEYLLSQLRGSIGKMPIADIEPADVLASIRKIESRGNLESARRTLQLASAVFRYVVATARLGSDPTRDLRGALTAPKVTHYGAITDAKRAGELLRAIDGYEGQGITKLAMQLAPHVFVRPGELRHSDWAECDLDGALWGVPVEKMKMRKPHHVPLSRQAIVLLREIQSISGPKGYVFPSVRTRAQPMSENTINAGLRRLGYSSDEMTAHGFRAMASTLLNESGKWSPDAIERALAHGDSDKVCAAWRSGGATISICSVAAVALFRSGLKLHSSRSVMPKLTDASWISFQAFFARAHNRGIIDREAALALLDELKDARSELSSRAMLRVFEDQSLQTIEAGRAKFKAHQET